MSAGLVVTFVTPAAIAAIPWRPTMPTGAAYALLPEITPHVKPTVYASLPKLAARIHRDRGDDALEFRAAEVTFRDRARPVTEVLARDAGDRLRRIGYAWTAGRDAQALKAELAAQVPPARVEG